MNTVESAKWNIIESHLSLSVAEQIKDIFGSAIADHEEHLNSEALTLTGATHTDGVGALWVEIEVEGTGVLWYTNQREDYADIMWMTASVETLDEIPNEFQN